MLYSVGPWVKWEAGCISSTAASTQLSLLQLRSSVLIWARWETPTACEDERNHLSILHLQLTAPQGRRSELSEKRWKLANCVKCKLPLSGLMRHVTYVVVFCGNSRSKPYVYFFVLLNFQFKWNRIISCSVEFSAVNLVVNLIKVQPALTWICNYFTRAYLYKFKCY